MKYVKQCKGQDISSKNFKAGYYWVSPKLDGFYTQIHYKDGDLKVYLSSGKELANPIVDKLKYFLSGSNFADFVVEAELIYKSGDLGSREVVNNLIKGNSKEPLELFSFRIFYVLSGYILVNSDIIKNMSEHKMYFSSIEDVEKHYYQYGYKKGEDEGLMLRALNFKYKEGKRVNTLLKYKPLFLATLKVASKRADGYLSLVDTNGITAKVKISPSMLDYIGNEVTISYERIVNSYVCARYYKN